MEQLTKNQAVATSQEAVQNQNEPQLRDENAHNDKSVTECLIQLTKLGYDATPFNQILKQNAKIGRASCRERVEMSGVAGSLKKKRRGVGEEERINEAGVAR